MLDVVISVAIALAAFAVLLPLIVFVHEYGHFKVARLCGIRVDTFSIGFGPRMFGWTDRKGTEWKVAAIPLGGFVKFFGDANAASAGTEAGDGGPSTTQFSSERDRLAALLTEEEKRVCFHFKPVWQRMLVVAAGPFSNFILAIAIFAALFMAVGVGQVEPLVGRVAPDSAAAEAGFEPGDRILEVDGRTIRSFNDVAMRVKLASDTELAFTVERGGEELILLATPRRVVQADAYGNEMKAGQLGIGSDPDAVSWRRYGPIEATVAGTRQLWNVLDATVTYLGRLVSLKEDPTQLGGPVKIAKYAGQAAQSGFDPAYDVPLHDRILMSLTRFLELAALISVSIGFLNLLPIPVLDGGHLVFYAYEAIAGKPLSDQVQGVGFRIGLALIGMLMVFVIVNDVVQLF
jgi:regulator of sigma E protease